MPAPVPSRGSADGWPAGGPADPQNLCRFTRHRDPRNRRLWTEVSTNARSWSVAGPSTLSLAREFLRDADAMECGDKLSETGTRVNLLVLKLPQSMAQRAVRLPSLGHVAQDC